MSSASFLESRGDDEELFLDLDGDSDDDLDLACGSSSSAAVPGKKKKKRKNKKRKKKQAAAVTDCAAEAPQEEIDPEILEMTVRLDTHWIQTLQKLYTMSGKQNLQNTQKRCSK